VWNHALKSLAAHKLRLALTAIAVVLGIAFMAGTLVLTGTIKHDIDGLFTQATSGYSVVVRATTPYGNSSEFGGGGGGGGGGANSRPLTPESLLPVVRDTPGVAAANGSVQGQVGLVGSNGKAITGHTGAPTIAVGWVPERQLSPFKLRTGSNPQGASDVVIDAATAKRYHLALGTRINVISNQPSTPFTLVGTFGFGSSDTIAGAAIVGFIPSVAQTLFGKPGYFQQLEVAETPGTNTDTLVNAIAGRLPKGYEAVTSASIASAAASNVNGFISTFNTVLLAFAFIALFVGAFLIFNTFSILVGQRTRELALLRALGASRGQVTTSVIVEAALTGLAGSVVGIIVGILLAGGLLKLLRHTLDLNSSGLTVGAGAIISSLVVGTLITVVAALGPSLRASRVPPVAALRDDAVVAESSLRRRAIIGSVVTIVGLGALMGGLFGSSGIGVVGLGAALTFIGVAMLVPFVAAPFARALARPFTSFMGVTGQLSKENAARNPRRTAATSATLMIGLALVAAIATLASSASSSFGALFTQTVKADYVVTASNSNSTFSRQAEDLVKATPGVTGVSPLTQLDIHLGNSTHTLTAIDAVSGPQLLKIEMVTGTAASLAAGQILVAQSVANSDHLTVGSPLAVGFSSTGVHTFTVGGTYKTNQLLSNYIVSTDVAAANTNQLQYFAILVKVAHPSTAAQDALTASLVSYPQLKVQTAAQFVNQQKNQIAGFVRFVYVMLGFSIVIALIGVINTLLLSVLERTHEIGLLRAVGMKRRQVRAMIRGEAVVVSVLGALLGLALGVGFGAAIVASLSSSGITQLAIPVGTIIVVLILALLFGVFAAIFPARRAARLDVLRAITTI
jgi:putative ABC transport system permease protein